MLRKVTRRQHGVVIWRRVWRRGRAARRVVSDALEFLDGVAVARDQSAVGARRENDLGHVDVAARVEPDVVRGEAVSRGGGVSRRGR